MGGRGGYSVRKTSFSSVKVGTKAAKQKAAATFKREERTGTTPTGAGGGTTHGAMMAEFKDWADKLNLNNSDGLKAMGHYQNGYYTPMNQHTRGTKLQDSAVQDMIKKMDSTLTHSLSKNIKLFRGTNLEVSAAEYRAATTVGGVFKDNGYFSSSVRRGTSESFIKTHKQNPVLYTVIYKKGTKGGYLDAAKRNEWENEFVPRRGTQYRVIKELKPFYKDGKKIPHLLIETI